MGHRHRSTRRYLLTKQRNDAAVASEYIAEANRHEFRFIMFVKSLDNHLADALAGPHDIGRIDRLIRGNHDKTPYPAHGRRLRRLKCTEYIILDRFRRTVFHQRYMLMRCRVIHNIRMICRENIVHAVRISHRSD